MRTGHAKANVWLSLSTSPYFNLGLEDWLFRNHNSDTPLLFLYRNTPCVVIGRNQNPWTEVNHKLLQERNIPLIRRRSGGGTVYHDLGNTNFSIHTSRLAFDRARSGSVPVKALRELKISASLNERHDIVVNGYKISYKIINGRAYHHGTMLLDCDIESLGGALQVPLKNIVTKGVSSVRSPVQNLVRMAPGGITHESFSKLIIESFRQVYDLKKTEVIEVSSSKSLSSSLECAEDSLKAYINRQEKELRSWGWLYGQTPEFTQTLNKSFAWGHVEAKIRSRHGVILSVMCSMSGDSWSLDESFLVDLRYGFLPKLTDWSNEDIQEDVRLNELYEWIKQEISL